MGILAGLFFCASGQNRCVDYWFLVYPVYLNSRHNFFPSLFTQNIGAELCMEPIPAANQQQ